MLDARNLAENKKDHFIVLRLFSLKVPSIKFNAVISFDVIQGYSFFQ